MLHYYVVMAVNADVREVLRIAGVGTVSVGKVMVGAPP